MTNILDSMLKSYRIVQHLIEEFYEHIRYSEGNKEIWGNECRNSFWKSFKIRQ